MPIDIETFEENAAFDSGQTNAEQILQFLARNNDQAFERHEIAEATEMDPNTVSAVLSRLKERGFVRHKPPYWAIGDVEQIRDAAQFSRTVDALNEHLGVENMDAWRAASADEPHPSERDDEGGSE